MKASPRISILSLVLCGFAANASAQSPMPMGPPQAGPPMRPVAFQPAMVPSASAAALSIPQTIPVLEGGYGSEGTGSYAYQQNLLNYQSAPPFGPMINFEANLERGLGYANNYYRAGAFVPYHIDPWTSLVLFDLAASGTDDGDGVYNFGAIYREYIESLQRVFGLNIYYDFDFGHQRERYERFGFGFESLGKYLDFRANYYRVNGPDSYLLSSELLDECTAIGHSLMLSRREVMESALSGGEVEMGGPVPFLGRYGVNLYGGGYYLDSDTSEEAIGFKVRGEVMLTESVTANVTHSNDDLLGGNTYVNIAMSFPFWRNRRILRNRPNVVERLADRVIRDNRIHANVDDRIVLEAAINPDTGLPFRAFYVDPDYVDPLTGSSGPGTVERPLGSLGEFALLNDPSIDIIRVDRRDDDTGTNLTVPGGLDLFDNQRLLSATKTHTIESAQGVSCFLVRNPANPTDSLAPLISNPSIRSRIAGVDVDPLVNPDGSVIRVRNNNTISGFRIDASDSTNTHFGVGIVNLLPITDFEITCNTFINHADDRVESASGGRAGAVVLSDVSGTGIFDDNTIVGMNEDVNLDGVLDAAEDINGNGLLDNSNNGFLLSTAIGSTVHLSLQRNTSTGHDPDGDGLGFSVIADTDSTIHANNPDALSSVPGMTVPSTGIIDNVATGNGTGMEMTARAGATINAVFDGRDELAEEDLNGDGVVDPIEDLNGNGILDLNDSDQFGNRFSSNTIDGFRGFADGGTINLQTFANTTADRNGFLAQTVNTTSVGGVYLRYFNGGRITSLSEDLNDNGILDPSEDVNMNGLLEPAEDLNGDGILNPSEDLNGNGRLDFGFVANTLTNNAVTGLCIVGEDTGTGAFDIGGTVAELGNQMTGNGDAGMAVDLSGSATADIYAVNNNITNNGGNPPALTIVLDFVDPSQGSVIDPFGRTVNAFDPTAFGFQPGDFNLVANAILNTVRGHYQNIVTSDVNPASPIPPGMELAVDFVIGDTGVAPSNGAAEYYSLVIGEAPALAGTGLAGQSAGIGQIRDSTGNGPTPSPIFTGMNGAPAMAVYTDNIASFGPFLTPPDAFIQDGTGFIIPPDAVPPNPDDPLITGLSSGNLTFTRRAVGLVTSHELGHAVSLRHIQVAGSVTPNGLNPIMATPAIDAPLQVLLEEAEFAFSGTNPGELPGEAPFPQLNIQQLVSALGLRAAGIPNTDGAGDGVRMRIQDSSSLTRAHFINNTISSNRGTGLSLRASDMAQATNTLLQGNTINTNESNGVFMQADASGAAVGMEATIDATIGGLRQNTLRGVEFGQGNTIIGNGITDGGDGIRLVSLNNATVQGSVVGNDISSNAGNGLTMITDPSVMDFFNTAENHFIDRNTFSNNTGTAIVIESNAAPGASNSVGALISRNTFTGNAAGGVLARLTGLNNPPVPPLVPENNVLRLQVGGFNAASGNSFSGNGDFGVAVITEGNGKADDIRIQYNTIIDSVDGPDPEFNGDGIFLRRSDASLITADILNNTVTGNAGDGLHVVAAGSNNHNPTQPMTPMATTIDWNENIFDNNSGNGAFFRLHGDSVTIADGAQNIITNNGLNGIAVTASENASFGDTTVGMPPGRRSVFDSNIITNNGQDGIALRTIGDGNVAGAIPSGLDESRILLHVASSLAFPPANPHDTAVVGTLIAGNGSDGISLNVESGESDIVVDSSAAGTTVISGNGTAGGGNGIRIDATGDSEATFTTDGILITGSIAGASEDIDGDGVLDPDEDLNGDGVLDAGEDTNGNGMLDPAEDAAPFGVGNNIIDVADGDGIQFNARLRTRTGLFVRNTTIQGNQDDGISVEAFGRDVPGTNTSFIPRPTIEVRDSTIGGFSGGVPAGNGGDGVSINNWGGIDTIGNGTVLGANAFDSGPILTANFVGNEISQNAQRGVEITLTGAAGVRTRPAGLGNETFDPVRISFTGGNEITSNGQDGIFYRANAGFNTNREVLLFNAGFPNDDRVPLFDAALAIDPDGSQAFYDPGLFQFTSLNFGTLFGKSAYQEPYQNLLTEQNSELIVVGNTIQNNGTGTVFGKGLDIHVGTNAYVAADVTNNLFGGNLESDFQTQSFLSAGNTMDFIDLAGIGTFDSVFLDDTAQLDLRFHTNSGDQINLLRPSLTIGIGTGTVGTRGAAYTNLDRAKVSPNSATFLPPFNTFRRADIFQVDNGPALDSPVNDFVTFGGPQDIDLEFMNGGYNLRAAADPDFPNIEFPPNLP